MKKNVFESELINGMQKELLANDKTQALSKLGQAVEYINSAVSILDEFGLTSKSDKLLRMLGKFAIDTNVKTMPSIDALLQQGVSISDLKNISKDAFARARINTALRALECSDEDIVSFIGKQNLMSVQDAAETLKPEYSKILDWIKNPKEVPATSDLKEGDEFSFSRLDRSSADDLSEYEIEKSLKSKLDNEEHKIRLSNSEEDLKNQKETLSKMHNYAKQENWEAVGYLYALFQRYLGYRVYGDIEQAIEAINTGFYSRIKFTIPEDQFFNFGRGFNKFKEKAGELERSIDEFSADDELIVDEDDDSTFEDGD